MPPKFPSGMFLHAGRATPMPLTISPGVFSQAGGRTIIPPTVSPALSSNGESIELMKVPAVPQELIAECALGDAVVYVGSGLSTPVGLPTWRPMVERLVDWAVERGAVDVKSAGTYRTALERGLVDSVADSIANAIGIQSTVLIDFMRSLYTQPDLACTPVQKILPQIPFAGVLTTNFDTLLEQAYAEERTGFSVYTPHDTEGLLEAHTQRNFYLLKLYGVIERPDTLLFSPASFKDMLADNLPFTLFMDGLLSSRTLLFVGSSLAGIEAYLSGLFYRPPSGSSRLHFALVNTVGDVEKVQAENLERRYNIRVIPFQTRGDFAEVEAFLTTLRDEVRQRDVQPATLAATPSTLKSIKLVNIGPFPELELEFDSKVNILLGDNGLGKTTILKAIAVGIVGEDTVPFHAGRLIRANTTRAEISLEASTQRTYDLSLFASDGTTQLRSRSSRPLEGEGWLAVGFPALRLITWQRYGDTLNVFQRPTATDLTPLISGEPDTRLDRVKQWIIDRESRARENTPQSVQFRTMLNDLYAIIERLTPGIDVKVERVDLDTKSVMVKIGDTILPLEAISQGTASLIGWICVLLQRMYDTAGGHEKPLERSALLLIDEIDAHMHPAWQKSILGAIRETFPNLQIIATTHSPLVIGGLEPQQVIVLSHAKNGAPGEIQVRKATGDLGVLRTDQILTSPLFGLSGTRYVDGIPGAKNSVIDRYAYLLGKSDRSDDENSEFETLRRRLGDGLDALETPLERQVERALRKSVIETPLLDTEEIQNASPEIAQEMRRQIYELLQLTQR